MGGARQHIEHLSDAQRRRVRKVESAAVKSVEMGEVIERGDDEVDRYDVNAPALEPDHRRPVRQNVAQLLDQLKEVVWAVDLVDLAGLRIADDDSWPIDPPRNLGLCAHQGLAAMFRGKIGMFKPARLFEHVLAENAVEESGGSD